jgi:hypothetical protein
MRGSRPILYAVLCAASCATGSAEFTNITPYSGTIELHGDDGRAMAKARELMAKNCGAGNYNVLQDSMDGGVHRVSFQCTNPGLTPAHPDGSGLPPPPPPR